MDKGGAAVLGAAIDRDIQDSCSLRPVPKLPGSNAAAPEGLEYTSQMARPLLGSPSG